MGGASRRTGPGSGPPGPDVRAEEQDGETQGGPYTAQGLSALVEHLRNEPEADRTRAFEQGLRPGAVIGRFELVRELGRGGFGVVFEARDATLGRSVAFKAIRPGRRSAEQDALLLREAESAAKLQHENIVSLFDFGRAETGPYLVLELLRGETLAARLARGPLPPVEAIHIAAQVARALAHAHEAGLLHRDLKPSNVFLTSSGGVKVLDLGLAHLFGVAAGASGTPEYMAPEQWRSEKEDGRTDLFALGVMLFELLSGHRPYVIREDRSTALDPDPEPALEVKKLPSRLVRLVERCIAKDPARRPPTARAVVEELLVIRRALEARGTRRRRRRVTALVAAAVVVASAGVAWWWARARVEVGRVPVAVLDFDDRSGEAGLEGLSSLLITSLEQSPRLEVLPRSRMRDLLRQAGREGISRIDEAVGREVAKLAGTNMLIAGTLYRFGEMFALEVRGIDAVGGRQLFSLKEQARGKDSLPDLLDRISEGVRRALHEPPESIRKGSVRLADAVTPNVDAWRHYFRGMDCNDRLIYADSYDECIGDFQKAVAVDPGFALAHFQISYLYFWQGRPRPEQKAALAPALEHVDRAPARDRLRIRGWAAYLDGRDMEAKQLLREAAQAEPNDKVGWYLAGEIPYHRDEFDEAIPHFQRAVDLEPTWMNAAHHLVFALGSTGRLEDLRALVKRIQALPPSHGPLLVLCNAYLWTEPERAVPACERAVVAGAGPAGADYLAIALLHEGDRASLDAHLRKMEEASPGLGFARFMRLLLRGQEGRWRDADGLAKDAGDPDDFWFHAVRAEQLVGLGDPARVWREAVRAQHIDPTSASHLAVHLAYLGDLAHAAELAPFLPQDSPRVATYQAVVKWRRGDLAGAIAALRPVAARNAMSGDPSVPFPLYLLGEALAEAGQDAEAVQALQRFSAIPLHYPSWEYPRGLYLLARSQERLGDLTGARRSIGRLLALWKAADPEQPLLREARALGARLGASR